MTTITQCSVQEAYLLKGFLEAEQITSYVIDESAAAGLPLGGGLPQETRLQVANEDLQRALLVLKQVQASSDSADSTPTEPFVPAAQPVLNALGILGNIGAILLLGALLWVYFRS